MEIIRVTSQEDYNLLMEYFDRIGKRWGFKDGLKATDREKRFNEYSIGDFCINNGYEGYIKYGGLSSYQEESWLYDIIDSPDFILREGLISNYKTLSDGSYYSINNETLGYKSLQFSKDDIRKLKLAI